MRFDADAAADADADGTGTRVRIVAELDDAALAWLMRHAWRG